MFIHNYVRRIDYVISAYFADITVDFAENRLYNIRKICGDYMWIYEHKNWSDFTWDIRTLASKLADIRYRQGCLLGRMQGLGFELKREASLGTITNDIIKSSAIEGENLNPQEVRSSVAKRLGINIGGFVPVHRDVEGIVDMMLDATQNFLNPLTKERLFDWHACLFPMGRSGMHKITVGGWRTDDKGPMQVISGAIGREKIHFEAPHANNLEKEMNKFIAWLSADNHIDPVIKAGIAHFGFVTIHPFEDGNGRIARAIGDMALARADGTQERFYSLSSQIEADVKTIILYLNNNNKERPILQIGYLGSWIV